MRDEPTEHADWLRFVFERYERPVVSYALRLLGNDLEAARDCAQETFLQLCSLERGHRPNPIDAWLFCTCRYRVIDRLRKERTVPYSATSLEMMALPSEQDASSNLTKHEEQQRLAMELDKLSDRQRQVILLRLNEGLSYKVIAERMGLQVNAVGVYLHEAVMKLRSALNEKPTQ